MHRTLDDVPVVTPATSVYGPRFAAAYQDICRKLNIQLAPACPQLEKAFLDSTVGTVLGIRFDTAMLTWTVSPEKRDNILRDVAGPLAGAPLTLEQMQHLMGVLQDFGQMCPFLNGFKQPLNSFLASLLQKPDPARALPSQVRTDLRIWANVITASVVPLPIPHRPLPPGLSALHFVSDAACARYVTVDGRRIPCDRPGHRGAASIGIGSQGEIWLCARVTWPAYLLLKARDEKNRAYGCKSTTLELVGLILPIITVPHLLQGKEVCFHVDNLATVYGWENKGVAKDSSASVMIRSLHLIATYLGCIVHVRHLPRMSDTNARLADRLSRKSTTTGRDRARIRRAMKPTIPPALRRWMESPKPDWDLPGELLHDVQQRLRHHHL